MWSDYLPRRAGGQADPRPNVRGSHENPVGGGGRGFREGGASAKRDPVDEFIWTVLLICLFG